MSAPVAGGPAPREVDLASVDLTDVDLFVSGGHTRVFEALRARSPIHRNEGADGSRFWALTRYEDVHWAYRNHESLSSASGAIVGGSLHSASDTSSNKMLVSSDLPRHRMLKHVIHPMLSASVGRLVAQTVRELLDAALARARAAGGCDFATDVATELPAGALMVIMGIGHQDAHRLIGLTRRMVGYRDEVFVDVGDDERMRLAWLQVEVFDFFSDIVAERRRSPGDDLVSTLLTAEVNGRRLTEEEIFYNCMNVAVGGNETTSYTACTGLMALMDNPEQYRTLREQPQAAAGAVEEFLRWSSTNAYVQRVATRDFRYGGVDFAEGDSLTLWNYSANRDESVFPHADRFDIGRSPNRHLTYGAGLHRCVGSPVAQAELAMMFDRLHASGVVFAPAGPARRLRSNFLLGVTRLPVEVA